MREMPVEYREIVGAGRHLRCRYSVLVEVVALGRFFTESYGVKVEEEAGDSVSFPGLTCSAAEIDELVETLMRCEVTPTGLPDVICDWKKRT